MGGKTSVPGGGRLAPQSPIPGLRFVEIDNSRTSLALLARFYRDRYVREFPDPDERESLANMRRYLVLKGQGWYGANNYHIVVAAREGALLGGVVFDYLAEADAGVIEFLFVDAAHRVAGLGRALLDESIRILRADARERRGRPLKAVVAEMNDPYRRTTTPDNMDPFHRAAIWGTWGFHALAFPYVQPALSAGQAPVDSLLLIARLFRRVPKSGLSAAWVNLVVAEYLRWAMRIEEPAADAEYCLMASFLRAHPRVPLYPLWHYVGRDPQRQFEVQEIDVMKADRAAGHAAEACDPTFAAAIDLLHAAIPVSGRVASPEQFTAAATASHNGGPPYHLWALHAPCSNSIDGMASFFTLPLAGFGGYIVLAAALRGRGILPLLLARIEAQMVRDSRQAQGWFIECGDEVAIIFLKAGFAEVPLVYRPPAVGNELDPQAIRRAPERLHLLYKPFGLPRPLCHLRKSFVLRALAEILRHVYGIVTPPRHACYRLARDSLEVNEDGVVLLLRACSSRSHARRSRAGAPLA